VVFDGRDIDAAVRGAIVSNIPHMGKTESAPTPSMRRTRYKDQFVQNVEGSFRDEFGKNGNEQAWGAGP